MAESFDELIRIAVRRAITHFVNEEILHRSIPNRNRFLRERHVILVKIDTKSGTRYYVPVLVHFGPARIASRYSEKTHHVIAHTIPQYREHLEEELRKLREAVDHIILKYVPNSGGPSVYKVPFGERGRNGIAFLIRKAAKLWGKELPVFSIFEVPDQLRPVIHVMTVNLTGEKPNYPLHFYNKEKTMFYVNRQFFHYYDYNEDRFYKQKLPTPHELENGVFYHPRDVVVEHRKVGPVREETLDRIRPRIRG